jgi:hypothetical protein
MAHSDQGKGHGKVQAKNHIYTPESAKECEGMSPRTPKWTSSLGVGVLWTPKSLKNDLKGQISLD